MAKRKSCIGGKPCWWEEDNGKWRLMCMNCGKEKIITRISFSVPRKDVGEKLVAYRKKMEKAMNFHLSWTQVIDALLKKAKI